MDELSKWTQASAIWAHSDMWFLYANSVHIIPALTESKILKNILFESVYQMWRNQTFHLGDSLAK